MKKRFSKEQIIGFLQEAEAGMPVAELCRMHALSEVNYYLWRRTFGWMSVSVAKRRPAFAMTSTAGWLWESYRASS